MSSSTFKIVEKLFKGYYLFFPFYILYLVNNDGGILHLANPVGWVPALIFGALIAIYMRSVKHQLLLAKVSVLLIIILHAFVVYAFFYVFTDIETREANRMHEIFAYVGIYLSLNILFVDKKWILARENEE